jgi:hypothetical protein
MLQKMTEQQATTFDRFSIGNALTVSASLQCGCKPYQDVFTFKRWLAQGYCVKKGEHGIKIPVIGSSIKHDDKTGQDVTKKYISNSAVFCRCQVKKLE